jgi:UDP-N-acetylmuramate dehydrogenase
MTRVRSDTRQNTAYLQLMQAVFGSKLQVNVPLARYTSARVGGPSDVFLVAEHAEELAAILLKLWEFGLPKEDGGDILLLGGGSNMLISDKGVRGVAVLNHARRIVFDEKSDPPTVWCESGANMGLLARQAAARGLAGIEWAAGIPGTVGGAVFGNAGAYGGELAGNLLMAEILHHGLEEPFDFPRREEWQGDRFGFEYRSSILKRRPGKAIVLSARLALARSTSTALQGKIESQTEHRRQTQPPGASMGSMFKNPPGDYAGRLIEAAGLKGARVGGAMISPLHANFFINDASASAADIFALIHMAQEAVALKFGINLQLEIELRGQW